VRSVCFKNDEGRNRAIASGALAASVRVLAEALDVLEYHGSGGATTRQLAALIVAAPASESSPAAPPAEVVLLTVEESAPELAAADAFAALVVVEEAANTLSALVNRHGASRAPGSRFDGWCAAVWGVNLASLGLPPRCAERSTARRPLNDRHRRDLPCISPLPPAEQNTARAIEDGAAVAAGRALALLPTLKWPVDPLPGAAPAGGAGSAAADPSLTAGTTTGATPASALQKATMLQMLLS
jgi:hypothetical protein